MAKTAKIGISTILPRWGEIIAKKRGQIDELVSKRNPFGYACLHVAIGFYTNKLD
jgi:hypothetical protein